MEFVKTNVAVITMRLVQYDIRWTVTHPLEAAAARPLYRARGLDADEYVCFGNILHVVFGPFPGEVECVVDLQLKETNVYLHAYMHAYMHT